MQNLRQKWEIQFYLMCLNYYLLLKGTRLHVAHFGGKQLAVDSKIQLPVPLKLTNELASRK